MRDFAPTVADRSEPEFAVLIEELVRAYDPCLSCSVH
jgi:coenzyme F420-reducing hydrogenase alpha subunit